MVAHTIRTQIPVALAAGARKREAGGRASADGSESASTQHLVERLAIQNLMLLAGCCSLVEVP